MSSIWPVLHYDDTERALAYLTDVLGLSQTLVARDDGGAIVHAELGAPGGGAVLQAPNRTTFGSGADAYATTVTDFEGNLWTFGTYAGA